MAREAELSMSLSTSGVYENMTFVFSLVARGAMGYPGEGM